MIWINVFTITRKWHGCHLKSYLNEVLRMVHDSLLLAHFLLKKKFFSVMLIWDPHFLFVWWISYLGFHFLLSLLFKNSHSIHIHLPHPVELSVRNLCHSHFAAQFFTACFMQLKFWLLICCIEGNRPCWPGSLSCHFSNSNRDRRLSPSFESRLRHVFIWYHSRYYWI